MRILVTLIVLLLEVQFIASAQQTFLPPDPAPKVEATRLKGKIVLDGKLDEPDWKAAKVIGSFVQVEPNQGRAPHFATQVKLWRIQATNATSWFFIS